MNINSSNAGPRVGAVAVRRACATLLLGMACGAAQALPVSVTNAGFEDVSGQASFNEFTFGTPAGWELYDPNGLVPANPQDPIYVGTLALDGVDFFNAPAPEGSRVAILFGRSAAGNQGEYGFQQTLSEVLSADVSYTLSVEVGNIGSGVADSGEFFNLDGFPGYRIELLAGGQVIAQDDNGLDGLIPEGEFATATLSLSVDAAHPLLGEQLGIRLVNLNLLQGAAGAAAADVEVDFDDVRLSAVAATVSEGSTLALCLLAPAAMRRRWVCGEE